MIYGISPSSYEPIIGETTNAVYPEGCMRYQSVRHLIKDAWPRTELHPIYSAIGTIAEEFVRSEFDPFEPVEREVSLVQDLGDNVHIRGRADYMLPDKIIEVKASVSASKRAMWRRGEMSSTHLGQIKTYMVMSGREFGVLRAFYMHFTREGIALSLEPFVHQVRLTEQDVEELSEYYLTVKHAIVGADLPPKPMTNEACMKCPFNNICKKELKFKSDFVDEVNTVLMGERPEGVNLNPTIKRHNRR